MPEGTVTTSDGLLTLDVREALTFLDDPPKSAMGHATAVVGVLGRTWRLVCFRIASKRTSWARRR